MSMPNRRNAPSALAKQKDGGGERGRIPPTISVKKFPGDISFEMRGNRNILSRRKPQKLQRVVYDPSQHPNFALHAKDIEREREILLETTQDDAHTTRAIIINYNRLIKAVVELATDFSLSPHWEKYELEMEYALDTTLDRTILNMREGGFEDTPVLLALKQEVHSRVSYLTEQKAETYKEKTTCYLNKIMQQNTQDWSKGH